MGIIIFGIFWGFSMGQICWLERIVFDLCMCVHIETDYQLKESESEQANNQASEQKKTQRTRIVPSNCINVGKIRPFSRQSIRTRLIPHLAVE